MVSKYWYDQQLKRFASQFAAIFGDMQVMTGKRANRDAALIDVPIIVAPRDRVAAAAATGFTQNRHFRIPMMSAHITGMDLASDRMKGTGVVTTNVRVPIGGSIAQDGYTVRSKMGIPYNLKMDLTIVTSNAEQQFQILEQILPLFDPTLQIQPSDSPEDKSRIVTVQLLSIGYEDNFPPGTELTLMAVTLSFQLDIWITVPAEVRKDLITKVIARIVAVDGVNAFDLEEQFSSDSAFDVVLQQAPPDFQP
jgi:hypothetical protein